MARIARIVVPGVPHHVTQRGNRKQKVFFSDNDRESYLHILRKEIKRYNVDIWAYCLMDTHVHFVAVPRSLDGLAKVFGETHKKYTFLINKREGWKGYLWQGRFSSFAMDETHLREAIRYIEKNPLRARIVSDPTQYSWSSARAHSKREDNNILSHCFLLDEIQDWKGFLSENEEPYETYANSHLNTSRPFGDENFIEQVELIVGKRVRKFKPGPKKITLE